MALQYTVLKLLPKNALSRAVGALCRLPGPRPVVQASMRAFAKAVNVDMSEAEFPLEHYPTFTEFFTRRLKAGARPITPGDTLPVSPVDGTVGMCGRIEQGTLVQAKGRTYTLAELVGGPTAKLDAEVFEGGTFVTIYLAPYNYHRIHTPLGGQIQGYCNVPGNLWPVNAVGVENVDKLFCVNERLTTYIESPAGACAVVKVGATNVGRIRALYADVVTNAKMTREVQRVRFERPVEVAKGGEIAMFEMGSTVVLLFQKAFELGEKITLGTPIKLGEPLGKVA
ncbi:MAG: phosphatidylserine decarboxylase [Deltaproteobacteria bacterium]|nr:phosphatidylserine decarboxylase [Deltaproteobacteria bacterium]